MINLSLPHARGDEPEPEPTDQFEKVFGITYADACVRREKYRHPVEKMTPQERFEFCVSQKSGKYCPINRGTTAGKTAWVFRQIFGLLANIFSRPFLQKKERLDLTRKIRLGYQFENVVRWRHRLHVFLCGERCP